MSAIYPDLFRIFYVLVLPFPCLLHLGYLCLNCSYVDTFTISKLYSLSHRFVLSYNFCVLILDIPDVGGPTSGPLTATITCI
jgi:hypothetical protein